MSEGTIKRGDGEAMTEEKLREIVFRSVDDYGPVEALAMMLQYAEDNEEFRIAAAKYGHVITEAIREAKMATVH